MRTSLLENLQWNERISRGAGFLIVTAMMATLSSTFSYFGRLLAPGWDGRFLVVLGVLVTLEAIASQPRRDRLLFPEREWVLHHSSEWLVILILVKLVVEVRHGLPALWNQVQTWDDNFFEAFFTPEFVFSLGCVYFVWLVSLLFAGTLWTMRDSQRLLHTEQDGIMLQDRWEARRRLSDIVLFTGLLQVFVVALLRSERFTSWTQIPQMRGGVFNTLAFFALGLLLLSLGQLSSLKTRWNLNRVVMSRQISTRWVRYSLIFLAILLVFAFAMPTGYTLGILGVLQVLVGFLWDLLSFLLGIFILLLAMLISAVASLFGRSEAVPPMRAAPRMPNLPVEGAQQTVALPDFLRSLVFWVVIVALVGYALVSYLKSRQELWEFMRRYRWMGWVEGAIRWMAGVLGLVNRGINEVVEAGMQRVRSLRRSGLRRSKPGSIDPRQLKARERVRYYFLAFLRRSEEEGLGRRPGQTPYEYAEYLHKRLDRIPEVGLESDAGEEIDRLTESFVLARYSRAQVEDEQAGIAERAWMRLRDFFSRLKQG